MFEHSSFYAELILTFYIFTDLDHTADIQCHTWGPTLKDAFQTMAFCMFNYMTDMTKVSINPKLERAIEGTGCWTSHTTTPLILLIMHYLYQGMTCNPCCTTIWTSCCRSLASMASVQSNARLLSLMW